MSSLFLRTLREDPADAEVPSHRLLVRAGYIRRVAPGGFAWLPLGYLVYRNVERVVREEMDRAGFQEVHFPALLPREPYEVTGRWTEYGDDIFRLKDRRDNDFLLAPTHEELFTLLAKEVLTSYRDLPRSIYQIQTKYRDEPRPRAGLLRVREFVMKDSYSFDLTDEGLEDSYEQHREAYEATLDRLGLEYVIVAAHSGAMGGSASEEFLVPVEAGEDTFVRCVECEHAANVEALVTAAPDPLPMTDAPEAHVEETPGTPTIQTLVDLSNEREDLRRDDRPWEAADTLKNVLLMLTYPDGRREPLAVGLPGDREVDDKRLAAQVMPAEPTPFTEADFAAHPSLTKGYIGPGVLGTDNASGIRYLLDPRVVEGTRWITGADEPGRHVYDLTAGRDFTGDGTIEAAEVRAGDTCPVCGGELEIARGVELGHIFQLGRKYAEALELSVLDDTGVRVTPTMGSYGFGVSRAVAVIAEATHDELGLCWPEEVAPAQVHVVVAGTDEEVVATAERLATELEAAGRSVLLDDRDDARVGVKFNDAELLGMPIIVVVGRGLKHGVVELRDRRTGEREDVPVDELVPRLTT